MDEPSADGRNVPPNPFVNTHTSPHLAEAFAIVGWLVALRVMDFDLDDRQWVDDFEIAVTEVARLLKEFNE